MSRKRIEKYIPKAIEVLERELEKKFENNGIPSAYNGYISTFGVSIVQSGLKPTVALFQNGQSNTQESREDLNRIILQILDENYNGDSLLEYVLENENREDILKREIIDITIALKLSIRTFELDKGDKNE